MKVEKKVTNLAAILEGSGFREYVDYLSSPWKVFWYNLFAGVARGLGFVLGGTVVVAVVIYVIANYLANLPFVGRKTFGDCAACRLRCTAGKAADYIDSCAINKGSLIAAERLP